MADCHPDKKHFGRGMCKSCYMKMWTKTDSGRDSVARTHRRVKSASGYRDYRRGLKLKQLYGITGEQYETMLRAQGGVCAICGAKCPTGRRLAVDHCHRTGLVRGLLCAPCNKALERIESVPGFAANADNYLKKAS